MYSVVTRLRRDEAGQALPLIVLFLLVMLGAVALILDGGYAFAQKRIMQNAADAAALSAMTAMVKGEYRDTVVRNAARTYAQLNRADSATLTYLDANGTALPNPNNGLVPSNAAGVRVTAQRNFPTFFARLMGVQSMTASAQASATSLPAPMPSTFTGLAPLSVPSNFYDVCANPPTKCDLWDSQYHKKWGTPSWFKGLLDLSDGTAGGSMPKNVSDWTEFGYPGTVNLGQWLQAISGDYGNNVAAALRNRITAHPGGVDPDGVIWGTIDIVIWDGWQNNEARVSKFGRFKIRMTDIFSSHVYGYFIDFVVPGHQRGPELPAGPRIVVLR